MFGYIYKTTNLINNKIYIGKHIWHKAEIDKSYLGSGVYLKKAIDKYGKSAFICEILDYAETLEELNKKEIEYILKFNSMDPSVGYNLTRSGDGTYLPGRCLGHPSDPEVRKKISNTLKKLWNDPNSIFNSLDYRNNLSEACKKSHFNNKRKNAYIKISKSKLGHEVSQETKNKISETLKKDTPGHRKAKQQNQEKHLGKIWINNSKEQLLIKKDLAQKYLDAGWVRGRLPYSEETLKHMAEANKLAGEKRRKNIED